MGRTFEARGETIRATFEPIEVELLVGLRDELVAALEAAETDDPAIVRLFPTAVLGDQDADRELRAMLRDDLLAARLEGLQALVELLERGTPHRGGLRLDLADDDAVLVLGVLNDLRLALGAWMDVEALERREDLDDETLYRLEVMDHFAWMQEQLLAIIDPASVSHYLDRTDADDPTTDP